MSHRKNNLPRILVSQGHLSEKDLYRVMGYQRKLRDQGIEREIGDILQALDLVDMEKVNESKKMLHTMQIDKEQLMAEVNEVSDEVDFEIYREERLFEEMDLDDSQVMLARAEEWWDEDSRKMLPTVDDDDLILDEMEADFGPDRVSEVKLFGEAHGLDLCVQRKILKYQAELASLGITESLEDIARDQGLIGEKRRQKRRQIGRSSRHIQSSRRSNGFRVAALIVGVVVVGLIPALVMTMNRYEQIPPVKDDFVDPMQGQALLIQQAPISPEASNQPANTDDPVEPSPSIEACLTPAGNAKRLARFLELLPTAERDSFMPAEERLEELLKEEGHGLAETPLSSTDRSIDEEATAVASDEEMIKKPLAERLAHGRRVNRNLNRRFESPDRIVVKALPLEDRSGFLLTEIETLAQDGNVLEIEVYYSGRVVQKTRFVLGRSEIPAPILFENKGATVLSGVYTIEAWYRPRREGGGPMSPLHLGPILSRCNICFGDLRNYSVEDQALLASLGEMIAELSRVSVQFEKVTASISRGEEPPDLPDWQKQRSRWVAMRGKTLMTIEAHRAEVLAPRYPEILELLDETAMNIDSWAGLIGKIVSSEGINRGGLEVYSRFCTTMLRDLTEWHESTRAK